MEKRLDCSLVPRMIESFLGEAVLSKMIKKRLYFFLFYNVNGSAFRVGARGNRQPLNQLEKGGMGILWKINIFLKVQDSADRAFSNFQLYSSRRIY